MGPIISIHEYDLKSGIDLQQFEQALRDAEAVVLLVDHRDFQSLDLDLVSVLVGSKRVLDARNALDRAEWQERGFEVSRLGAGMSSGVSRVNA